MTFTVDVRWTSDVDVELNLAGDLLSEGFSLSLQSQISGLIVADHPELLRINLEQVTALSSAGIRTLIDGYSTAISHGTSYQVRHARGAVRRVLKLAGVLSMLADSDDVGALLLATMECNASVPPPRNGGPHRNVRRL
jgi:anti-anti-sigma factor